MPYRIQEQRESPQHASEPRELRYRCTRCGTSFDSDEPRCPSCLRRSAVVAAGAPAPVDVEPSQAMGAPGPTLVLESRLWPRGSDCPLCAARAVDDSVFFVRISKHGRAYASNAISARGLCCRQCRARVEALGRLRFVCMPFVLGGIVAWPFSMALDIPGLGPTTTVLLCTLACAILVGVPIVLIVRAQGALRHMLEETSVFLRMRDAVERPRGLFGQEHWVLSAKGPTTEEAVDLKEFLDGGTA